MNKTQSLYFEQIKSDLIRFGFSYYGVPSEKSPDPERLILLVCAQFERDRKTFGMLMRLLIEILNLIHVERFKNLIENDPAPSSVKYLAIYILAARMSEEGDVRFVAVMQMLAHKINSQDLQLKSVLKEIQDPYLLQKQGEDQALKKIGISAYRIMPAEKKKVLNREQILKRNLWLRLRVMIGTNYRADGVYLKFTGNFKNRYQIWKALGSSQETAYRICNELEDLGSLKNINLIEDSMSPASRRHPKP